MTTPIAVLDACVLYRAVVTDVALSFAEARLVRVAWSEATLDELEAALKRRLPQDKASHYVECIRSFQAPAPLTTSESCTAIALPDPSDVHVAALAAQLGAPVVTYNLQHFPDAALEPLDVVAMHSDAFLSDVWEGEPAIAAATIRRVLAKLHNPRRTAADEARLLKAAGMHRLSAHVASELSPGAT